MGKVTPARPPGQTAVRAIILLLRVAVAAAVFWVVFTGWNIWHAGYVSDQIQRYWRPRVSAAVRLRTPLPEFVASNKSRIDPNTLPPGVAGSDGEIDFVDREHPGDILGFAQILISLRTDKSGRIVWGRVQQQVNSF